MIRRWLIALILCTIICPGSACTPPGSNFPWPTAKPHQTEGAAVPTDAAPATPEAGIAAVSAGFCDQKAPLDLIAELRTALLTEDGTLLASLVDPIHGTDVQLIRSGPTINFGQSDAADIFVSDASSYWGQSAGSGLAIYGSFRALVLPELLDVLNSNYLLACDRILLGGTTFAPAWPYASIHYYSAFHPGTDANGGLDWRTWLFGMRTVHTRQHLYAVTQLRWEP